jgi:cell division protein FtsN
MASKRPYDDLETDYLEEENESGFLSLVSVIIAFIAVAVFIALAWYAYQSSQKGSAEEIEVVYPEEGAIREAPEETGGWQFPHQDKSVYNIVSGEGEENGDAKVEQILPAPEEPLQREKEATNTWMNGKLKQESAIAPTDAERLKEAEAQIAAAEAETSTQISESQAAITTEPTETQTVTEAPVATVVEEIEKEEKAEEEVVEKPAPAPKPVAKKVDPKPQPQPAPVAAAGTAKLQLGAVSSEAEARAQWNRIRAKFSVLGNKTLVVQSVNANGKTLYRIQASGFASRNEAKAACSQMSAAGQACFAVGN